MSSLPAPNRAWPGLATAVRAVFVLLALSFAMAAFVDVWRWTMASGWVDDPATISITEARSTDTWDVVTAGVCGFLSLLLLVLFIIWLYQAHHSPAMNRDYMEHGSGWAIGGWFTPILNYFRPVQMVEDLRRGSSSEFRNPRALTLTWWLPFLAGRLCGWVIRGLGDPQKDRDPVSAFRDLAAVQLVQDGLYLAAAVAGTVLVAVVTREVLARHAAVTTQLASAAPPPPGAAPLPGSTPAGPRTP